MRALNSPSPRRRFIWRRKGKQRKDKRHDLVRREITCFSRNYCSDIRAFQKITFARQSHRLSPTCLSFGNDLDVRRKSGSGKIAAHAEGTFWYVLPSLPMFLLMPWMLKKEFPSPPPRCRNCTDWSPLFRYDQSFGQIWDESLSVFGFLFREPFICRIKSGIGTLINFNFPTAR